MSCETRRRVPVWVKLTPTTTNIAKEAEAAFGAGADAISSSNTFTSLPLIDPESLEFEVSVEGKVSYGGLGGPAILPLSLAKMAQMTTAFPDKSFSGIGGIAEFAHALNYFLLGCGTVQVCTAAMLDHAIGPDVDPAAARRARAVPRASCDGWLAIDRRFPRSSARPDRRARRDQKARPFDKLRAGTFDRLRAGTFDSTPSGVGR